ncbi:Clr5 domain-containing protein [Xylaria grammica]|nr:Clr5 domain-containing protein [Xylaria grammica]
MMRSSEPNSRPGSVRSSSPHTSIEDSDTDGVDESYELQRTTHIYQLLYQLQDDLIAAVRMIPPAQGQTSYPSSHDACAKSSVESAIKKCFKNALERWSFGSQPESSGQVEASASRIAGTPDNAPSAPHEVTTQFPNTCFNIPSTVSPQSTTEAPNTQPFDMELLNYLRDAVSGSIDSTSPEPFNAGLAASVEIDPYEPASRASRRPSKKEWDKYRPILERLYIEEHLPLFEVIKIMEEKYHFFRTTKQYRYQLGEKWGWKKYKANTSYRPGVDDGYRVGGGYPEPYPDTHAPVLETPQYLESFGTTSQFYDGGPGSEGLFAMGASADITLEHDIRPHPEQTSISTWDLPMSSPTIPSTFPSPSQFLDDFTPSTFPSPSQFLDDFTPAT